jgi:hypothetical protein
MVQATTEQGVRINTTERIVLAFLADNYQCDGICFSCFAAICDETTLDRKAVRRACRSLTRKGLAQFSTGLWSEDGEPRGSGYAATRQGAEFTMMAGSLKQT